MSSGIIPNLNTVTNLSKVSIHITHKPLLYLAYLTCSVYVNCLCTVATLSNSGTGYRSSTRFFSEWESLVHGFYVKRKAPSARGVHERQVDISFSHG